MMKRIAIIVAGGSGKRMHADVPKQFMLLGEKPVLLRTIERIYEADKEIEIIVALPKNDVPVWKELCERFAVSIAHEIAPGGETRFHSVKNGLEMMKGKFIVAIHDGVRPFASSSLINRCFSEAETYGTAVPAVPLNESIRKVSGNRNELADRSSFFIVQTPQCFDSDILKEAYKADYRDIFTDDASVVEFHGAPIHLIEGEQGNIKITFPLDLLVGEAMLKNLVSPK